MSPELIGLKLSRAFILLLQNEILARTVVLMWVEQFLLRLQCNAPQLFVIQGTDNRYLPVICDYVLGRPEVYPAPLPRGRGSVPVSKATPITDLSETALIAKENS
jgi:hypothetical protein